MTANPWGRARRPPQARFQHWHTNKLIAGRIAPVFVGNKADEIAYIRYTGTNYRPSRSLRQEQASDTGRPLDVRKIPIEPRRVKPLNFAHIAQLEERRIPTLRRTVAEVEGSMPSMGANSAPHPPAQSRPVDSVSGIFFINASC